MASQKQLEAKYKQAQTTADDWYRRAQLALQKGDEELAKEALKRRKSFQENADGLKSQYTAQKQATESLLNNTKWAPYATHTPSCVDRYTQYFWCHPWRLSSGKGVRNR